MNATRAYFRRRAIERQRDPEQDARNEAAAAEIRERVEKLLAQMPALRQLSEKMERPTGGTG